MVIIAGEFKLNPERRSEALEAMRIASEKTLANDKGCIQYHFYQEISDPDTVLVFERWASYEDILAHVMSAHMPAFHKALNETVIDRDIFIYQDVVEEPCLV